MNKVDSWWHDGVIYQIYPRSFADSNNDGIGDINGITGKLDYLADLGISAIWLSPINPSPDVDFGYDVADYKSIDPKFGTMKDFDNLILTAHKRNIHVILDLVLNHTSNQHPWFLEAKKSRDNPFHDWYLWHDRVPGKKYPNNWRSIFGGPGWEYLPEVDQYYYHMFCKQQPDLNWRNPAVYSEMLDVFRFWLKRGVNGFRLDVFNEYYKDAQFRNNPVTRIGPRAFECQHHLYDCDQPEIVQAITDIRKVLDEYPGSYAVGESFLIDTQKVAQYCGPGMLHATFNFNFMNRRWEPKRFLSSIIQWENALNDNSWGTYALSNHDVRRPASRYAQGESDKRMKVMATMLFTLRGTPFMYYGDEIGMRNSIIRRKEMQDPIGKRYWPAPVGRDGCRTPMQWDGSKYSGFSSAKPWIRVHANHTVRNVQKQLSNPDSLYSFYRKLLHLRKENPVLINGMFLPLTSDPIYLLAYMRKDNQNTILVALNFSHRKMKLFLGRDLCEQNWQLLLSTHRSAPPDMSSGYIQLMGDETLLLKLES
jgi:alpha-glucosidase